MNKFKVNISGMTCTGCEKHVESALEKIGAKNIESSYRRGEAVEKVQASAVSHGLRVMGMEPSPLPGQDGNVEYFLWCKK